MTMMTLMKKTHLLALSSAAALTCTTTLHAQTPQLPPPESVSLDKLGVVA